MQPNNRLITATTFSSVNFTYRHNRPHYIFPPLLRIVVWLPKEPSSRSLAYCRDLPLIGRLLQGLMRTLLIVSERHLDGRWSSKRGKHWCYVQPGTLCKVPKLNTKCCRVQMKRTEPTKSHVYTARTISSYSTTYCSDTAFYWRMCLRLLAITTTTWLKSQPTRRRRLSTKQRYILTSHTHTTSSTYVHMVRRNQLVAINRNCQAVEALFMMTYHQRHK